MDLILWRHADAEDAKAGTADTDRRLSVRGLHQAEEMAAWLRAHALRDPRVLASPAERARQTAEALKLPFKVDRRIGIGASTADLIGAADWPDCRGTVILIGHQPSLGRLAALLLAGEEADWTIKKGGIWWFSNRVRADETQTVLKAVANPSVANIRLKVAA